MSETLFYNLWRTSTAENRQHLIAEMQKEAPAIASKAGFRGMRVLEAEDGRVLVEGRWISRRAFDTAIANDAAAQESRRGLEAYGTAEPGIFVEAFHVSPTGSSPKSEDEGAVLSATSNFVTFIQIWNVTTPEHQQRWLETMHERIGLLTRQRGFVSMSLHVSTDGQKVAVYAQWQDEATMRAAIELPEAKASHDEMARWGTPEGTLYRVDSVFLPAAVPST